MTEKTTPLMKQYGQIKNKFPDTILLFRLGDFFETFNDDAIITSKVCGITLTKRNNGAAGDCPLAGFPHHQLDAYLPKLVKAGYRVAVCDQLEDPKASHGIVRRGITEVVTPGVALYDKLLDTKRNNFVASVVLKSEKSLTSAGLAFLDISTAEFFVCELNISKLIETLETIIPSEIIISKNQKNDLLPLLEKLSFKPLITKLEPWIFEIEFSRDTLLSHFKTKGLKGFGIENFSVGLSSAGAVLHYINETQAGQTAHLKSISIYQFSDYMILDFATKRNLEITFSMSDSSKEGTLISILDKTQTPMGGRLFKQWLIHPLINLKPINSRLAIVQSLVDNNSLLISLRQELSETGDLERLISKVCTNRANPRDVVSLKLSLRKIPAIINILKNISETEDNVIKDSVNTLISKLEPMDELVEIIEKTLIDEPSVQFGLGNIFRTGYSPELDSYIDAKYSGKNWVAKFQEEERERSGISSLKVSFNSVFGYYIEITKVHNHKIPENYTRKQTLTNAERYITPELKEIEDKILNAEAKIVEIESNIFSDLRFKIAEFTETIQKNAVSIAAIDCLQSFAQCAIEYNYCKPEIDESKNIEIIEGRHPVVERLLPLGENFTPNNTKLTSDKEQIHILTGPNMSGKSCYLRQVGLIILLGQIGSFVPAKKAKYGIIDRIFTRVGAQDNISSGESTFLVEMQEAANIMNNATDRSLILLDEVGRGTATYDGISIAWAITEFIHNVIGAKTLFATHYHELNDLAQRFEKITNYKVEVIEAGETIIFTHKVLPGASDHSFGIHVAQMAGMPQEITDRANVIMRSFESGDNKTKPSTKNIKTESRQRYVPEQMSIFEFRDDALREQILNIDLNNITPLDALKILGEMQKKAQKEKK
ncbi:DNA mismatch repair protein MutS [Bacteroidetes/Chlorobi group bacterium ChocPot_Mid]|nr:MAG: DNA mismatch repair protein MutS [Bacteroidetes/Chlorobi group bacterium ChocPot_Mid]